MYTVYIDGRILDYPGDTENCIAEPALELALNDAGDFEFSVPPDNPEYENIFNRQSVIQVFKEETEVFTGEVRECEKDADNLKVCYAVGELAYLYDSIQPQAKYENLTPRQLLETMLNYHNSQVEEKKKFYIGIVTITNKDDSLSLCTDRENTLSAIRELLVEPMGGYLRIRKSGKKKYLDWITLTDYGTVCQQPIMFGENLLDYVQSISASEIATACVPLGARLEESKIEDLTAYTDITSVNNGKDYVYLPEAVDRFGWVKKVVEFDSVTDPVLLKQKGEEWLKDNQYETLVLELSAVDLSVISEYDYDSFELGDRAKVYAKPYGLERVFPIQKMKVYLHEPDRNILQLGETLKKTYTREVSDSQKKANQLSKEQNRITTEWMQSAVDNLTQMMTGSEGGYKIEEYDEDDHWLRTLIMDAPNKEDAENVLQFNKYGIGGSHNGFEGPYTVGMTLDGTILGERIKAGSVSAEKLSAEYKSAVTDEINTTVTAKFEVAEGLIEAEVSRAKGEEKKLSSRISITEEEIKTKVTEGEVESIIYQNADSIRLRARNIMWESDYSSMSKNGVLTCQGANINGIFESKSENGWGTEYVKIEDAIISGGSNGWEYGLLDLAAQYDEGGRHISLSSEGGTVHVVGSLISLEGDVEILGSANLGGMNGEIGVGAGYEDITIIVKNGLIMDWY